MGLRDDRRHRLPVRAGASARRWPRRASTHGCSTTRSTAAIGKYIPLIGGVSLIVLAAASTRTASPRSRSPRSPGRVASCRRSRRSWRREQAAERELPGRERATAVGAEDARGRGPDGQLRRHDRGRRRLADRHAGRRSLGLIGPNGAGKTSLIDAVTGFTDGRRRAAARRRGHQRAGRRRGAPAPGLGRSFQSLELFEDSTVLDNLRAGVRPARLGVLRRATSSGRSTPPLPGDGAWRRSASSASRTTSSASVEDLPYGQRRLLAIARAVATAAERAAARRARRRPRRRRDRRARPPGAPPGRRLGDRACCSSSTT